MNTLVEIGPNLVAALERIDPGETPVTQIATVLEHRSGLLYELKQVADWFEENAEALDRVYPNSVDWQTPLRNVNAALERIATPALACPSKEVES